MLNQVMLGIILVLLCFPTAQGNEDCARLLSLGSPTREQEFQAYMQDLIEETLLETEDLPGGDDPLQTVGEHRIARGGSRFGSTQSLRSANRSVIRGESRDYSLGLCGEKNQGVVKLA